MTRSEALSLSKVYYIPLPEDVYGSVRQRRNGGYMIAINSTQSAEAQAETLEHELSHIRLGHFQSGKGISTIEAEADALSHQERHNGRPIE